MEKGLAVSWSLNNEIVINKNFVDGEWVNALSGKTLEVINPNNEEFITKVPAGDKEDVQKAALAAKKASLESFADVLNFISFKDILITPIVTAKIILEITTA